jgi:hypothetical protein
MELAGYFELDAGRARAIAAQVGRAVSKWRDEAAQRGLTKREIDRMASPFEHQDLETARAIANDADVGHESWMHLSNCSVKPSGRAVSECGASLKGILLLLQDIPDLLPAVVRVSLFSYWGRRVGARRPYQRSV